METFTALVGRHPIRKHNYPNLLHHFVETYPHFIAFGKALSSWNNAIPLR
jgi:hypothetical protein